ncbi:MAG: sulfatase-like hydrolase/transferase, partial [Bacteroidales bacterium]|nr:sulfatase-like hydrolase/transferase [Bacteroidales bacterium]
DTILSYDAYMGQLIEALKARGTFDETLIIVYSDHAMGFQTTERIPLVFHFPAGQHAGRITTNVQNLDIAPTILDYLGIPIPEWMEGESILHFKHRTGHAVRTGEIRSTDNAGESFWGSFRFNTGYNQNIYAAEAPDAIEPSGKGALTAFRYTENNTSAAVMFSGTHRSLVMGFPFETIIDAGERDRLMVQIINFLSKK